MNGETAQLMSLMTDGIGFEQFQAAFASTDKSHEDLTLANHAHEAAKKTRHELQQQHELARKVSIEASTRSTHVFYAVATLTPSEIDIPRALRRLRETSRRPMLGREGWRVRRRRGVRRTQEGGTSAPCPGGCRGAICRRTHRGRAAWGCGDPSLCIDFSSPLHCLLGSTRRQLAYRLARATPC